MASMTDAGKLAALTRVYEKTFTAVNGRQHTDRVTVSPCSRKVIISSRTDGIVLPYTSATRRSSRFPSLLAWRIGQGLKAGGYREVAS